MDSECGVIVDYIYELINTMAGQMVKRTDADGIEAWIPLDPANSDYQAYLASLEPVEKPKSK
jgi:hypothetical protein